MSHFESFYTDPKNVKGDLITLTNEEVHHLSRVKRHKTGDTIWVVDGTGGAYQVRIESISSSRTEGRILQTRRRLGEPRAEIILAQALIKGDRFEWVIEKSVEIGVHRIIPLITEKTVMKAGSGKLNRWNRINLGAMKQSGRSLLPEITEPKTLKQVCAMGTDCQYRVIAHAGTDSSPFKMETPPPHLTPKAIALVGPEAGFTDTEIEMALENGFTPVSLGPRRLRAETAGIVMITLMLSQWGELC